MKVEIDVWVIVLWVLMLPIWFHIGWLRAQTRGLKRHKKIFEQEFEGKDGIYTNAQPSEKLKALALVGRYINECF